MKKIFLSFLMMLCGLCMVSLPCEATTVDVGYNSYSDSGIYNAYYTATLSDGTILGFNSNYYFCGAISTQTSLTIPDSIRYNTGTVWENTVAITSCRGYWYDEADNYHNELDFRQAQSVTSLTLPATITSVSALAPNIKTLYTNGYIGSVSSDALTNLDKVLVPATTLSSYYTNEYWSNYVLINAKGTQPLKVTINMTKAGEFAQLLLEKTDDWYKVNELTVVGELNENDLNVFKRMRQLTKLDLSKAVISKIPNQFDGSSSYNSYRNGFNILEELILPEVKSIGDYAFSGCYKLTKITMPKVQTIGYGAFAQCGASQIIIPDGVATIGDYAFYNSNLKSITIPSSIAIIEDYCFYNCTALVSATIPSSVTQINRDAFYHCSALKSIELPGVKTIGSYAFYECEQLSSVKFAEGLTEINSDAFSYCTALKEIDLPSSMLSVYFRAFAYCSNIKKVTCRAIVPPNQNSTFMIAGCDMTDVKLYVPSMSIDTYRATGGWKNFYTILAQTDKINNLYIYDNVNIDDASTIASDCSVTMDWGYDNYYGNDRYGSLEYNATQTMAMKEYTQYQSLGTYDYWSSNPYYYYTKFTSLISNGSMKAEDIKTILKTSSNSIWYFISLPYDVKVSDITYPEGCQFVIRKYSGLDRAMQTGNTWHNLTTDSIMHAYEGYILKCNKSEADFTFPAFNNGNKNKIFAKDNVVMPLGEYVGEFDHNRSWNLIGNPYPCYYDTRRMDFTAPFLVWNRYNSRYDAFSPVDDEYILYPTQAFFVQRPVDKASITFDKAGRQTTADVKVLDVSSKARDPQLMQNRKIFNIFLSDGQSEDHTRIVLNDKASCSYELDKDAAKFIESDNASMLLYTVEDGVKYAINERSLGNGGVQLGLFAKEDGEYTLSLRSVQNEQVTLVDNETKKETLLNGDYTFTAQAGFSDTRFTLIFGEATGIADAQVEKATINTENGKVTANAPYTVYTADGRVVATGEAGKAVSLNKGIYIVNSKDVKRKIVVR